MKNHQIRLLGLKLGTSPFHKLSPDIKNWLVDEAIKLRVYDLSIIFKAIIEDAFHEDKKIKSSCQIDVKKSSVQAANNPQQKK